MRPQEGGRQSLVPVGMVELELQLFRRYWFAMKRAAEETLFAVATVSQVWSAVVVYQESVAQVANSSSGSTVNDGGMFVGPVRPQRELTYSRSCLYVLS